MLVLQCMQTSSTVSSILFWLVANAVDAHNEACGGVLGPHVVVRVLSDVFWGVECLILC